MGPYSILLLGAPAMQGPDGPVPIPNIKAQALLWYLAEQGDRPFFRAHLASLLWDSDSETDRRNSLNSTLSRMRKALPLWPFLSDRDRLAWDRGKGVAVDTEQLAALLRTVRREARAFGAGPSRADRDRLAAAVALWRGPFLAGFEVPGDTLYDEWLDQKRNLYETLTLDTLSQLIQMDEMAAAWPEMASRARQAMAIDPLQETFHRSLMTALYQLGDRAAALAQYSECRRLLAEELGTEPDPATSALRDIIAKGRLLRPSGVSLGGLTEMVGTSSPGVRDSGLAAPGTVVEGLPAATAPAGPVPAGDRPKLPSSQTVGPAAGPVAVRVGAVATAFAKRTLLVGRERELESLSGAMTATERNRQTVIFLCGEEGAGKTRLVEEIEARWRRERPPGSWFTARCAEELRNLPLAPLVAALDLAVKGLVTNRAGLSSDTVATLARLFPESIGPVAGFPLLPEPGADESRRRSFQALADFLEALPHPTVLVIEDSQWADADTWSFIAFLARRATNSPPVVLVTARSSDLPEGGRALLERMQHEGELTRLELGPLSGAAVQALAVAAGMPLSPAATKTLSSFTGGNPWFTVETLRAAADTGWPQTVVGEGRVDSGSPVWPVPAAIRASVSTRLARLSPAAREVALVASVSPEGLPFEDILQATALSEFDALEGLEVLVQSGTLEERTTGEIAFRCDLIRQAVLASMSRARRESLGRKTASK